MEHFWLEKIKEERLPLDTDLSVGNTTLLVSQPADNPSLQPQNRNHLKVHGCLMKNVFAMFQKKFAMTTSWTMHFAFLQH